MYHIYKRNLSRSTTNSSVHPPRSNACELPNDLKKHCLSFLALNDLLNVRRLDTYCKNLVEQTINEQKRRLVLLQTPKAYQHPLCSKGRTEIIPPAIEESLANTFSSFKFCFRLADNPEEVSRSWEIILRLLHKPYKNITLEMDKDHSGTLSEDDLMAKSRNYLQQLNNQLNLRELSIFYPLTTPLNLPNLKSLQLTITEDFAELTTAFNPLPALKDLTLLLNNKKNFDLATMPTLPPNLQELKLICKYGQQPLIDNLQTLNHIHNLKILALYDAKALDVNLSFKNLPLTTLILMIETPNLQTLNLPSTLTELRMPTLEPTYRKRHIAHLFENLATMCPRITTLFLQDFANLSSLFPDELAALSYLRLIKPNFFLTNQEAEELILSFQKQWSDLKVHKISPNNFSNCHLQIGTGTLLKLNYPNDYDAL